MPKLKIFALALPVALVASSAFAQDNVTNNTYNNYGTDTTAPTSTTTTEAVGPNLKNEAFGLKPAVGTYVFVAPNGQTQARGLLGLLADINLARFLPEDMRGMYVGITTGALYGHLGSETSNFFGTNPSSTTTDTGANLLEIPANLEIGYNISPGFRAGIHGGGNVIYRSSASSMAMGDSSSVPGSVWRLFPDVGLDFDGALGKNVSVFLRPDYTFTPGQDLWTAAVGLTLYTG